MCTNQFIFEEYNRVFTIIPNTCGTSKYKIFLTLKITADNLEPRLFSDLLE